MVLQWRLDNCCGGEEGTAEAATPDAKAAPEVLTAKKEEGEAKK